MEKFTPMLEQRARVTCKRGGIVVGGNLLQSLVGTAVELALNDIDVVSGLDDDIDGPDWCGYSTCT